MWPVFISAMSRSRQARESAAERPLLSTPDHRQRSRLRQLPCQQGVLRLIVRIGLIPEKPVCKACHKPLPMETARKNLHLSLMRSKCRVATNTLANTPLFEMKYARKFLAALQGWCFEDKACSIVARTRCQEHVGQVQVDHGERRLNTLRQARRNGEMVVGGPGVIVEVDECHLHKRKYD